MAKKAKKAAAGLAVRGRKTKKAVAVKSATKARKPARKKPPRKASRRSAAEVAKLRRAILAGARKGKSAETIAAELGISKAYVYALKNRG
jgi:DNA-binding NarL/FixJ family response regulator